MAAARAEADGTRERAAEQALSAAGDEAATLLAEAEREAAAVRDRAGRRTPALADRVVALVREDLVAGEGAPLPPEGQPTPGRQRPRGSGP
ncbi:hypothetical protein [Streptomyces sp. bgisy027]|uniref:hypothetical protein n=1 Tax=unclassified Streptomyces TaxID=2593676 RepID=UPI003D733A37